MSCHLYDECKVRETHKCTQNQYSCEYYGSELWRINLTEMKRIKGIEAKLDECRVAYSEE